VGKRFGVRQLNITGEKLSACTEEIATFTTKLAKIIEEEDLNSDQMYNCDETGLNYKMLPTKTLAAREEKSAPGYKRSKERLTVMACSNASGEHKLKLTLIGKSKNPRAFKNVNVKNLPVNYANQKMHGWIQVCLKMVS
jgi:hypothetical protein